MNVLKKILAAIPTLITSLLLAFFVWFSAVNSNDPNEIISYTMPIPIEILGQNPQYTISAQSAKTVTLSIKAPRSVHATLSKDISQIRASINVSELSDGQVEVKPEIVITAKPSKLVDYNPKTVRLTIEKLVTKSFEVTLNQTGNLAMGLEAKRGSLDAKNVQITGPESKVKKIGEVLATIDMSTVTDSVFRTVDLRAVDDQGNVVDGVNLSPSKVTVTIPITQKGGYKNAAIALIPLGSPAFGFQITHTEITPQFVTLHAKNPAMSQSLPELIETMPLNLNGRDESFEERVKLNLPEGVVVVGDVEILVRVTIEPTITSKSVRGVPVTSTNLGEGLDASFNISLVDVYLTGPTNLLATNNAQNLTVVVDLTDLGVGTHQVRPVIVLPDSQISYRIMPEVIEVKITRK